LDLRSGSNTNFVWFDATDNPDLTCIYVDDNTVSYSNWYKDTTATYVNDEVGCLNLAITYVPDDNFEQALIDLGYDSGDLDDYVPTDNISGVTILSIPNKNISDLTGIEDFTALSNLYCHFNQLSSLDVSANTALTYLYCHNNNLTSLDVTMNTALKLLHCSDNQLSSLDVSENTALTYLACNSNRLTSLDVSTNTALTYLACNSNRLTNLDVSRNAALTELSCDHNQLTSLDMSANATLADLECNNNQLSSLDVSANTALVYLKCYSNQLTNIDVSANTTLEILHCAYNQLSSLDLSANTALTRLFCYSNLLTSLDLRNGNNANLANLRAEYNPDLKCIYVDDNSVSYSVWQKDETSTYVNDEAECSALAIYALKNVSEERISTYANKKAEYTVGTIDGQKDVFELSLFPNPVKGQFTIQTNKKVESLKLYNVSGKLVKEFDVQGFYSVSGLPAGIYYLIISCENETFTRKLIVE
jgi:hypothetical protein